MKVEVTGTGKFVVADGPRFFCFFVDHDRSCWTSKFWRCHQFTTRPEAEEAFTELRSRQAIRRKERKESGK